MTDHFDSKTDQTQTVNLIFHFQLKLTRLFGPFIFVVPFFRVRSRFECYKIGYQYFSLTILTFGYLSREWPTVGTGPKSHFLSVKLSIYKNNCNGHSLRPWQLFEEKQLELIQCSRSLLTTRRQILTRLSQIMTNWFNVVNYRL